MQPSILWASYKNKTYVIIKVGEHNGQVVGLTSQSVPEDEAEAIRDHLKGMAGVNLRAFAIWLKENAPESYRNAYRHFKSSELSVFQTWSL